MIYLICCRDLNSILDFSFLVKFKTSDGATGPRQKLWACGCGIIIIIIIIMAEMAVFYVAGILK